MITLGLHTILYIILSLGFGLQFGTSGFEAHAAPPPPLVVIDPGHGGQDIGTVYRDGNQVFEEKTLTLELSKEIARELKKRRISAFLTRTSDRNLAVPARTAIANKLGAKLFISVHMNASPNHESLGEGFETFILNTSSDESSKRLADLENSVLEGSIVEDARKPEVGLILKDLVLDGNRERSYKIASQIQRSVTQAISKKKDRGVKQALFYVLLGADMPSVLIEAGFLDHPHDRRILTSPEGRRKMARSIAAAIDQHL